MPGLKRKDGKLGYERNESSGSQLPDDLPVWEDIDPTHQGLTALGLTERQIEQIWK